MSRSYIKGFKLIIFLTDFGYKLAKKGNALIITYPNGKEAVYPFKDVETLFLAGEGKLTKSLIAALAGTLKKRSSSPRSRMGSSCEVDDKAYEKIIGIY